MDEPRFPLSETSVETTPNRRGLLLAAPLALIFLATGAGVLLQSRPAAKEIAMKAPVTVIQTAVAPTSTLATTPATVTRVPLPTEVRGLYWTAWTAATKRADELTAYALATHLNTMVIDLKLDNGTLAFIPKDPSLKDLAPKSPTIKDLDGLLAKLAEKKIYRIARIFVMRDGAFGKLHPEIQVRRADGSIWRDKTGTAWLDPAAPAVTDYAIALAREAYARGFDEVQFDYVRFPSDGQLSAIRYPIYDGKTPKTAVMRTLFERIGTTLKQDGIPVSFDLFGLTLWNTDGLGIGQLLADSYPFADFISPMVYPSHYASGFQKFANPALYPYDVVYRSLIKGTEMMQRNATGTDPNDIKTHFRPWLQDFDIGATYDAPKIEAQIKATRDAGASGWMLWNARNVYTPATYVK